MEPDRGRSRPRRRGVSEVTGLILLFGIVMAGVALILITSTAVQDDIQERNRIDSAEVTMTELDNRLSTLSYQQPTNLTGIDFTDTEEGQVRVRQDSTTVNFTINENAACRSSVDLGAVEYAENERNRVAYEAGGVFRVSDGQAVLVQPPEMEFRNGTVTFVAHDLSGTALNTSTVYATKRYEQSQIRTEQFERDLLTDGGDAEPCKLRNNLTVTARGPYYQAWAEFFRQEFSAASVTVDAADRSVSVFLTEDDVNGFDSDGDGIVDAKDNCPADFNPRQRDTDDNDVGDVCDPDDDGDEYPDRGYYDDNGPEPGDGLKDEEDNCQKRPNPGQRDEDGDGLGDICDPDIDGDGMPNLEDNCFKNYNPAQKDLDGDGRGNACDFDVDGDGVLNDEDNCPYVPNPSQSDIDDGGRGDACDPDMDGDGIPNTGNGTVDGDNCPATPNPNQTDSDDDGVGDVCEDIPQQDYDEDGVINKNDNCPLTKNPDQRNTDKNRYGGDDNPRGDECDGDDDGDGVIDVKDNCEKQWNPRQVDTDNNSVGNVCDPDDDGDRIDDDDNCPLTYNPRQVDSNNDGTGDACANDESAIPDHDGTFVDVIGTDATRYREVTVYLTVDTEAGRRGNLDEDDFRIYEDYRPRNVTEVRDGERTGLDIVFVFDDTASMNGTAASMKASVRNFTEELSAGGVSARYGLVTVNERAEYDQRPVFDVGEFRRAVDAIEPANGTDERPAGLDGVYAAANRTDWRNETHNVVVYVSNDPADSNRSVREAADALNREGVSFYAVSPPARRGADKPESRQVVDAVGGKWLNVRSADGLDPFIDDVESDLLTQYAVTFESCRAADGSERDLAIVANDSGSVGRGNTSYDAPNSLPGAECDVRDPSYPDPDPDRPLPTVPGEGAENASDDDMNVTEIKRPECDADETPDHEDVDDDDATDVPDPDSDGIKGCYPSEIPDYGPGEPPDPYTNVVNVNVDVIRISNTRDAT